MKSSTRSMSWSTSRCCRDLGMTTTWTAIPSASTVTTPGTGYRVITAPVWVSLRRTHDAADPVLHGHPEHRGGGERNHPLGHYRQRHLHSQHWGGGQQHAGL